MRILLRFLSVLAVWSVVFYIVVYVDPVTIRDIGLEGYYLPFVLAVAFALWYTVMMIYRSILLSLIICILTSLALLLAIVGLINAFTLIVIFLLILFSIYLFRNRDSVNESVRPQ